MQCLLLLYYESWVDLTPVLSVGTLKVETSLVSPKEMRLILPRDEKISKTITGNKTWLHHFDPESTTRKLCMEISDITKTKRQPKGVGSSAKVYVISSFNILGMMCQHIFPAKPTVTEPYYKNILIIRGHISKQYSGWYTTIISYTGNVA